MNAELRYLKSSVLMWRHSRSECSRSAKMHRGIFPERNGRPLSYAWGRRAQKSTKETCSDTQVVEGVCLEVVQAICAEEDIVVTKHLILQTGGDFVIIPPNLPCAAMEGGSKMTALSSGVVFHQFTSKSGNFWVDTQFLIDSLRNSVLFWHYTGRKHGKSTQYVWRPSKLGLFLSRAPTVPVI